MVDVTGEFLLNREVWSPVLIIRGMTVSGHRPEIRIGTLILLIQCWEMKYQISYFFSPNASQAMSVDLTTDWHVWYLSGLAGRSELSAHFGILAAMWNRRNRTLSCPRTTAWFEDFFLDSVLQNKNGNEKGEMQTRHLPLCKMGKDYAVSHTGQNLTSCWLRLLNCYDRALRRILYYQVPKRCKQTLPLQTVS